MRTLSILLLLLVATRSAPSADLSADALIDKVIHQPGEFNQMCDAPPPIDTRVPLPLFGTLYDREINLSPANIELLKTRRAEVVDALNKRLAAIDLTKPAPRAPELKFKDAPSGDEADQVAESGVSPYQFSAMLFQIVVELDAVETLPTLLAIEEKLRSLLAAADANPKTPPPPIAPDGSPTFTTKKLSKREKQLEYGRVLQRELLSVMLHVLRRQKFQPVLDSSLEKAYEKALVARAGQEDLKDIKTAADVPEGQVIRFDPIVHVPMGFFDKNPSTPFTPQVRDEIRGFVQSFLDEKR